MTSLISTSIYIGFLLKIDWFLIGGLSQMSPNCTFIILMHLTGVFWKHSIHSDAL